MYNIIIFKMIIFLLYLYIFSIEFIFCVKNNQVHFLCEKYINAITWCKKYIAFCIIKIVALQLNMIEDNLR